MSNRVISVTAQAVIDSAYMALQGLSEKEGQNLVMNIAIEAIPFVVDYPYSIRLSLSQFLPVLIGADESATGRKQSGLVPLDRNDAVGRLHKFSVIINNELDEAGNQHILFNTEFQEKGKVDFSNVSHITIYGVEESPEEERRENNWARMRSIDKVGEDIVQFLYHAEFNDQPLPTFALKAKT